VSGYLANLARRSVGMVPVAHPRVGPASGSDARLVRDRAEPAAPGPSERTGPSLPAGDRGQGTLPDGVRSDPLSADDATSETRELAPRVLDEPRRLRLVETSPNPERRVDGGLPPAHAAGVAAGGVAPPVEIRPAPIPREPAASRDLVLPGHETSEASAGSSHGSNGTVTPRVTVIEPALSPAHLASARTVIESRGRGRDVDVRIGTIEIHAEPASPAPAPPAPPATAVAGRPQGGFDDFARLRTYAPWER
jgi:hypothetical protein